jgi:hypothetical protein
VERAWRGGAYQAAVDMPSEGLSGEKSCAKVLLVGDGEVE